MRERRQMQRRNPSGYIHDEIVISGNGRTSCLEYGCVPVDEQPSEPPSEPAEYEDLEDDSVMSAQLDDFFLGQRVRIHRVHRGGTGRNEGREGEVKGFSGDFVQVLLDGDRLEAGWFPTSLQALFTPDDLSDDIDD